IRAQLEGGTAFGLTAALYGEISFEKGRVKQRNFHDYPLLRIPEIRPVEPHVVPSDEKMGGVGEPGVPSVAPAVANAIFAATGKRLRRLPIRAAALKKAQRRAGDSSHASSRSSIVTCPLARRILLLLAATFAVAATLSA